VPRDQACYTCHTDYTMYGDVNSKLRGLRHVYAYYIGKPAQPIKLYKPYNNRECLHCHLGARGFEESEAHNKEPNRLPMMKANQLSCSSTDCHNVIHRVDQLKDALFGASPMKSQPTKMLQRMRIAGVLLIAGLLVELVTLHWSHPTSFLFFLIVGGSLIALGIAIYLLSLVSGDEAPSME
jgi:hypothetical protein